MAWRRLNAEELAALDDLARVRRYIERQCEIPDTPQQTIEVSLDDYNLKTERIITLEAELQSDRQWKAKLEQALQSIANLWPDPDCCAELVPEWVMPNDGGMRADTLWYALNGARKALGLPEYPEPEHWSKNKVGKRG